MNFFSTCMIAATALLPTISLSEKVVCVVPVADLVGEPASSHAPRVQQWYGSLPLASKNFTAPSRVHQLLFNEVVELKEIKEQEALIELPHLFYETNALTKPQTSYWTLKKNLRPLSELARSGISTSHFPQPLARNKDGFEKALRTTASLKEPFFDPTTKQTYSAGTRFVIRQQTDAHLVVHLFDAKHTAMRSMNISKKICQVHEEQNSEEKIKNFVSIVTAWAHQPSGFIPYVWGGCSAAQLCTSDQFREDRGTFTRELPSADPLAGLDCTGLVARAAHIAGIPYFYKNSFTLSKYLKPLLPHEKISEGDLIWIPGHVMVVSSLRKNSLVEARHYSHGYGKIHEIPLAQQFKGVTTYQQLSALFFGKKTLQRLDITGTVVQRIPEFKILKMASVWQ